MKKHGYSKQQKGKKFQMIESSINDQIIDSQNQLGKIIFVLILIIISLFLTWFFYRVLKTDVIFSHFFYLPTIFSCVWWKKKGMIVVIFLCLILILSHILSNGLTMDITNTMVRLSILSIVGITICILSIKGAKAEDNLKLHALNLEKIIQKRISEISNLQLYNRGLIETSPDPLLIVDIKGIILDYNKALANLTGLKRKEIIKSSMPNYFVDVEKAWEGIKTTFIQGELRDLELTLKVKNGARIIISYNSSVYKDKNSKILGAVFIGRDITKRKEIENALQKSYNELEHTLKELTTTQAKVLQSEKMASVGQLSSGIAHEINNPIGFISSNLNSLQDYIKDIKILFKKYQQLQSVINKKILPEKNNALLLEQIYKINTLEQETDIDFILTDISDLVKESIEGTERIKNIVMDLKNFAHPGYKMQSGADINKHIESTLRVVWNELKYKAKVTKDLGDIPQINCFPQQLNQVFMNLLVNAAQAIERQGEIHITTRVHKNNGDFSAIKHEDKKNNIIKYQPKEYIKITISDTGKGIPEKNLSKIFDPFFTTKDVGKGTGLGLHIVYDIIQNHRGTIEVQSKVGEGTIFIIQLPV